MDFGQILLFVGVFGLVVGFLTWRQRRFERAASRRREGLTQTTALADSDEDDGSGAALGGQTLDDARPHVEPEPEGERSGRDDRDGQGYLDPHAAPGVYALVPEIAPLWEQLSRPQDLLATEEFQRGVTLIDQELPRAEDLLGFLGASNLIVISLALEALTRRPQGAVPWEPILRALDYGAPWVSFFTLRALAAQAPPDAPVTGLVLTRSIEMWLSPALVYVEEFLRRRIAGGETPRLTPEVLKALDDGHLQLMPVLLSRLDGSLVGNLHKSVDRAIEERRMQGQQDRTPVLPSNRSLGREWGEAQTGEPIVEHPALIEIVDRLEADLLQARPPSIVLVGEQGVGKTTVMHLLGRRLLARDWTIIEAQHLDLIAGQMFVGQFEQRIQEFVARLEEEHPALWYVPGIHELLWTGQHNQSRVGALDQILPLLESRRIVLIGETEPEAYERLVRERPQLRTTLVVERIRPLRAEATHAVALSWAQAQSSPDREGPSIAREETLREAVDLAEQFLADHGAPGNVLDLLKTTHRRVMPAGSRDAPPQIQREDLMVSLTQMTGLPAVVLDDRQELDLGHLREHFNAQVMGQTEASTVSSIDSP